MDSQKKSSLENLKLSVKETKEIRDWAPAHVKIFDQVESLLNSIVIRRSKKQLLIFDLNGIIVERVYAVDKTIEKDGATRLGNFLCWKKPDTENLLTELFLRSETYEIAVWSSVTKYNVDRLAKFAFGKHYFKLLFVFNQDQCERVKNSDIETKKPLFLKNLSEVLLNYPQYDETNTLLIDDNDEKSRNNSEQCYFNPCGTNVSQILIERLIK